MKRKIGRRKRKKQKKILIIISLSLLLFLCVGYAAFSTNITLKAKGNIKSKKATEILKENVVDSGDGLYKDTYEEGRYIYKGANPNNYIIFNNETWRILSVENDESIKIIRNNIIEYMKWNPSYSCSIALSGVTKRDDIIIVDNIIYMIDWHPERGDNGCGDWEESEIKTYLNDTYLSSITSNKNHMVSSLWNIGSIEYQITTSTTGNNNLLNQINDENSQKSQPIIVGTITTSEYLRSNTNMELCGTLNLNKKNSDICKKTNWMNNIIQNNDTIWTLSEVNSAPGYLVCINSNGFTSISRSFDNTYGIIPSLYLSKDTRISGSGTLQNPYIITN